MAGTSVLSVWEPQCKKLRIFKVAMLGVDPHRARFDVISLTEGRAWAKAPGETAGTRNEPEGGFSSCEAGSCCVFVLDQKGNPQRLGRKKE